MDSLSAALGPLATEADIDAAELAAAQEARAETLLPQALPVDLFGDRVDLDTKRGRRTQSERNALRWFRRKYTLAGFHPLDLALREMHRRYEAGDRDGAMRICEWVMPYMAPRLSVVQMPGVAPPAQGGGVVRFTWEQATDAPPLPIPAVEGTP